MKRKKIILISSLLSVAVIFVCYVQFSKGSKSGESLKDTLKNIASQSVRDIGQAAVEIVGGAVKKSVVDLSTTAGLAALERAQDLLEKGYGMAAKVAGPAEEASFYEASEVARPTYVQKMALKKPAATAADKDDLYQYLQKYAPIVWLHPEDRYLPISAEEYYTSPESGVDRFIREFPFAAAPVIHPGEVTFQKLYDIRQYAMGKPAPSLSAEEKKGIETAMRSKKITQWDGKGRLPLYISIGKDIYFGSNPALNKNTEGTLTTPAYALAYRQPDGKIILQYIFIYGFNGPFRKLGDPTSGEGSIYLGAHEGDIEHVTIELDGSGNPLNFYFKSHGGGSGIIVPAAQMVDISRGGKVAWNQATKFGDRPIVYSAKKSHGNYPRGGSGDKNNSPYEYTYWRAASVLNDLTARGQKWEPNYVRIYPETDSRFNAATMGWLYFPGAMGKRGVDSPYNQGWFMNLEKDRASAVDKEGERLITRKSSLDPLVSGVTPVEFVGGKVPELLQPTSKISAPAAPNIPVSAPTTPAIDAKRQAAIKRALEAQKARKNISQQGQAETEVEPGALQEKLIYYQGAGEAAG